HTAGVESPRCSDSLMGNRLNDPVAAEGAGWNDQGVSRTEVPMDPDRGHRRKGDLFAVGDYSFWSRIFEPISEELIDAAGVSEGHRVLDIASGNGNTALTAARRRAIVTALDMSPAQIGRGRNRALKEGIPVAWVEANARHLPFADDSFDCTFNSFGDVIAVEEMLRVVRPGGAVGITEWTNEGFEGGLSELQARFEPRAGGGHAPFWGQEEHVRAAFEPHDHAVDIRRAEISARFESTGSFIADLLQKDPYVNDFRQRVTSEQWRAFCDELPRLAAELNLADDGSLVLESTYLLSIARKSEL
ncbi:MAG: methyltransferase domain-containing protein, partial [Actinomycetota bacterium]